MTIPNLSTHAEQLAHYAAIKRRLHGGKPKPKPKPLLLGSTKTVPVKQSEYWEIPTWKLHRVFFNDHVNRWKMRVCSTPSDWLRDRCKELSTDYDKIIGHRRLRAITKVRQQLMWEVSKQFPNLPVTKIGDMFGNRDRTTVLHAFKAHEGRMNERSDAG